MDSQSGFENVSRDGQQTLLLSTFKSYRYRWVVLAVFSISSLVNAMLWICFAPIAQTSATYYGVTTTAINSLSAVYMGLYLPGSLLNAFLLSHYGSVGLHRVLVFGVLVQLLGAWCRYMSSSLSGSGSPMFSLLMIGQIACGAVQPIFLNTCTRLAGAWFARDERNLATTISSMSNPIGIALGQVLPSFIVSDDNRGRDGIQGFDTFLLVQAILASVVCGLVLLFFRSGPPTPPSAGALKRQMSHSTEPDPFLTVHRDGMILLRDPNFRLLMTGFGIGLGMFNALSTVIDQVVAPVGYSEDEAGYFGAALIGAGLVGAGIAGPIMDATHKYKEILKVGGVLAFLALLFMFLSNRAGLFGLVIVSWGVVGFSVIPLLPVCLECAVECTYPISEDISSALLLVAGNYLGLVFTYVLDAIVPLTTFYSVITPAFVVVIVLMCVCIVSLVLYDGPLKRQEHEREHHAHAHAHGDGDVDSESIIDVGANASASPEVWP